MAMHLKNSAKFPRLPLYEKGTLLQFILHDFIVAYRGVQHLKLIANEMKLSGKHDTHQENLEKVSSLIIKLSGPPAEISGVFSWKNGTLTKLKDFCRLYIQTEKNHSQLVMDLSDHISHAWLQCFYSLELVRSPHMMPSLRQHQIELADFSLLLKAIYKMDKHMNEISRILPEIFKQFSGDENVVFFLVRHRKQFEEVYGPKFFINIINKMYGKGLKEVEQFLTRKFKLRGFDHLSPMISFHLKKA